jgi:hypothetical protein
MEKLRFIILLCLFSFFLTGSSFGQSSCDSIPDVGQTVGRCVSGTTSNGDYAFCRATSEGPICYYGESIEPVD